MVIAGERSVSEEQYHDTQLVSEKASERKRKLPLKESGRTCKLAELFLDGTCLPTAANALTATVSKYKDRS